MDRHGVERAWISVPPPLYRTQLDGDEARAWSSALNTALERQASWYPGRLEPLLHLPIQSPAAAASIARVSIARGRTRFAAPAGGRPERVLSDAACRPLWQMLDRAEALVFFHPGECADGRLRAFYLSNLLGNPYETSVAIAHLTFGGVLDGFPAITFCFAHGGGAAAMLAGRFERGFATARPGIDTGKPDPRAALRRLYVDCIVHDPGALGICENVFGPTQILFGSDWPFPMGLPEPRDQLSFLNDEQRRRIFTANPANLLRRVKQ